jgi:hypothetical protein
MKKIILFAAILRITMVTALISFTIIVSAQSVAVNTTGTPADASAMLDISSVSKGLLPPRMTTAQRTGIASPANGLMVFDTDTKSYWYFSTAWKEITGAGGSFSLPFSANSTFAGSTFSITNSGSVLGSSGIYGRGGSLGSGFIAPYSMGIWGDNSTGVGVAGTSNTIGVLGMTNGNDADGIGVKGVSSGTSTTNGAVTGINEATGVGVYGESTNGGIGIYGKSIGANDAIVGENNGNQGAGVYGFSTGTDGVGIVGTAGLYNSLSQAAVFQNLYASNNRTVVDIRSNGTGKFLLLEDANAGERFSVAKSGNIKTAGTITVENNKGIIRNSSSSQLRYEVVQAAVQGLNGAELLIHSGEMMDRSFNFSIAFPSAPAVSLGNLIAGVSSINASYKLDIKIINVTTTGFTIRIYNYGSTDFFFKGTWNMTVIGAE